MHCAEMDLCRPENFSKLTEHPKGQVHLVRA